MNALLGMCCAFLLVGVAYAKMDDEVKEVLKPFVESCVEEQNISPSDMENFENHDIEGEERKKLGCLKACVMKRMNTLVDGKPVPENMQEFLDTAMAKTPEKIPDAMEKAYRCAEEVKDIADECELAFDITRCLAE
ncbi:PREDICTED: uncharacterized protein LOC108554787 [Eufriesea mexicana]|uniref:uncharacterized protein LOC108554787 n=1 Tax=Eufriesea mexicana TaxID=516756 RepID=UPI00083BC7D7|nr:PREDICTED: uncharacterized protein LOC108554787 [Eufriesea mexicana]